MFRGSLAFLFALTLTSAAHAADCARPKDLRFEVTGKIVRSEVGFTQGLEWRDGKLCERTGAVGGHSGLNTIAPDGTVTKLRDDGTRYFGEGLTILNGEIYQLTWQEHEVFVYDLAGQRKRAMRNPREGWGLTNDGTSLIFSDGGPSFYFANPTTFAIQREVKIKTDRATSSASMSLSWSRANFTAICSRPRQSCASIRKRAASMRAPTWARSGAPSPTPTRSRSPRRRTCSTASPTTRRAGCSM